MKVKVFRTLFIAMFVAAIGTTLYFSKGKQELSDLTASNIEALAREESGNTHILECGSPGIKACEAHVVGVM